MNNKYTPLNKCLISNRNSLNSNASTLYNTNINNTIYNNENDRNSNLNSQALNSQTINNNNVHNRYDEITENLINNRSFSNLGLLNIADHFSPSNENNDNNNNSTEQSRPLVYTRIENANINIIKHSEDEVNSLKKEIEMLKRHCKNKDTHINLLESCLNNLTIADYAAKDCKALNKQIMNEINELYLNDLNKLKIENKELKSNLENHLRNTNYANPITPSKLKEIAEKQFKEIKQLFNVETEHMIEQNTKQYLKILNNIDQKINKENEDEETKKKIKMIVTENFYIKKLIRSLISSGNINLDYEDYEEQKDTDTNQFDTQKNRKNDIKNENNAKNEINHNETKKDDITNIIKEDANDNQTKEINNNILSFKASNTSLNGNSNNQQKEKENLEEKNNQEVNQQGNSSFATSNNNSSFNPFNGKSSLFEKIQNNNETNIFTIPTKVNDFLSNSNKEETNQLNTSKISSVVWKETKKSNIFNPFV